jgi:hypothetical protein
MVLSAAVVEVVTVNVIVTAHRRRHRHHQSRRRDVIVAGAFQLKDRSVRKQYAAPCTVSIFLCTQLLVLLSFVHNARDTHGYCE